jgi:hypothetical protein
LNAFGRAKGGSRSLNSSRLHGEKSLDKFVSSFTGHFVGSGRPRKIWADTGRGPLSSQSAHFLQRLLERIGMDGLSSQKLMLPSTHFGFLVATLRNCDNPIRSSCAIIRLSIIGRVCRISRNLSAFPKNCSSCVQQERVTDRREARIGDQKGRENKTRKKKVIRKWIFGGTPFCSVELNRYSCPDVPWSFIGEQVLLNRAIFNEF